SRVSVGFDEIYQASADKYPDKDIKGRPIALGKDGKHPLFMGETSPGYLQDRHDTIRVLIIPDELLAGQVADANGIITGYTGDLSPQSRNPHIRSYRGMDDFLFEKEFTLYADVDQHGEIKENTRETANLMTVNIMGGYEDMSETDHGVDYDYSDLMFTVYIAPGIDGYDELGNDIVRVSQQWWEREEGEGLTGGKTQRAVTFNNVVSNSDSLSAEEILSGNFNRITADVRPGSRLPQRIWTMYDPDLRHTTFPRAVFVIANDQFILDKDDAQVAEYLKNWTDLNIVGDPIFYYTNVDAMNFLVFRINNGEDLDGVDIDTAGQQLVEHFSSGAERYVLRHASHRYGLPGDPQELLTKQRADLVDGVPSSLSISKNDLYAREVAGALMGYKTYTIPAIKTRDYVPLDEAVTEMISKSFLAGEAAPRVEGGVLSFGSEAVPFRTSQAEIEGDTIPAAIRKTGVLAYKTVAELYADPYPIVSNTTRGQVWGKFGMKDRRGAIGYHRGGDLTALRKLEKTGAVEEADFPIYLDRYEPAVLYNEGTIPFRLAGSGGIVAQEWQNPDEVDARPKYSTESNYDDATFVIDRPLDGAGVLVVNGNLVIRDRFAYHGILVVTGDLVIRPTLKKDQFAWSLDGWPLDSHGNRVIPSNLNRDQFTGYGPDYDQGHESWFYMPSGMGGINDIANIPASQKSFLVRDKKGELVLDFDGNEQKVLPLRQDEYCGELIIQGKLVVKGRIITAGPNYNPDNPYNPGEFYDDEGVRRIGRLNAYWSRGAIEEMSGMFPLGKPTVERVSWVHNDSIAVDTMWQDQQD
ncbi:MAG: hypothetical protein FWG74_04125, partial [Planctomycetes bacterium]|nr:hypothetical protein [Planctomycetota bacterium]